MIAIRKALPVLMLLMLTAGTVHAHRWTTIDVPGAVQTQVFGINLAGDMVGEYVESGASHGFLLRGGTFTTIEPLGAIASSARGINERGEISGTYQTDAGVYGFLFDGVNFTTLEFVGASQTHAWGINNAREIVGHYLIDNPPGDHGFRWSNGVFTTIDAPKSQSTDLFNINDHGDIVGMDNSNRISFLLTRKGTFRHFSGLGVMSINDEKVVVGQLNGSDGFRFDLKTKIFVQMRIHKEPATACYGINATRQIVGAYDDHHDKRHGFVWTK